MKIADSTAAYEKWLANFMRPIAADLRLKHELMRQDAFQFLRATYYRWVQQWACLPRAVAKAPRLLAIGDIHVENFGTWRDGEGRLVWGVNDFDEAASQPYTNDLVRLAVSGMLARDEGLLRVAAADMMAAILLGYAACLTRGGSPLVIEERNPWLRELAENNARSPARYWARLMALPACKDALPRRARKLLGDVPRDARREKVVHRVSGAGSLGRPRFAAIYTWRGGLLAREAKARVPSAWTWATGAEVAEPAVPRIWQHAIRCQDPYLASSRSWTVRRLAPDCSRIDLGELPRKRQEIALFRAMGWEIANVHLGSPGVSAVPRHLGTLGAGWLHDASAAMRAAVLADYVQWRRGR